VCINRGKQASWSTNHLWTCREQGTFVDDNIDNGYDLHDQLNSFYYVDTGTTLDPTDSAGKTPTYSGKTQ